MIKNWIYRKLLQAESFQHFLFTDSKAKELLCREQYHKLSTNEYTVFFKKEAIHYKVCIWCNTKLFMKNTDLQLYRRRTEMLNKLYKDSTEGDWTEAKYQREYSRLFNGSNKRK